MGQMVGVSISLLGIGPQCIHPLVVAAMFGVDYPEDFPVVEDARYKHCVGPIENGNNEPFLNYDIPTPATILDFTIVYVILKNHEAMIQFRDGLQSIDSEMKRTENYAIMKILLTYSECVIDFDQFMALYSTLK